MERASGFMYCIKVFSLYDENKPAQRVRFFFHVSTCMVLVIINVISEFKLNFNNALSLIFD